MPLKSPNDTIRVGSRNSRLALIQVQEVQDLLVQKGIDIAFDQHSYQTQGDVDKTTSLTDNTKDDFFTDTLDQALLNGEIDVAIHSAKDLPQTMRKGLEIFALTPSQDSSDSFVGKVSFKDLAVGNKVGTSSFIRQDALRKLNPNIELIDIRGTIEERIELVNQGICDGIIVATIALKRLGLEDKITDIMPWEGAPCQGQLAVMGRSEDIELKNIFSNVDVRKSYGRVLLVGAGPGNPDLLTIGGMKALKACDFVFYDYLVPKALLNYAPNAEKVYVGKRKGDHTLSQVDLSRMLKEKAMEGKKVVRLKGGDPLIFGRGADEIVYLRSFHIDVGVIPGVSSATAIPSDLGIPLTARDLSSSVAFLSGHSKSEGKSADDFIDIPKVDTLVFLMGLTKLDTILRSLRRAKWKDDTPIVIISKGTCSDERIIDGTLKNIRQLLEEVTLGPPALIVVGQTVKYFQNDLYKKEGILYTGTNPKKYARLGKVFHFPMVEIIENNLDEQIVSKLIADLDQYHLILITSRFAVRYFFNLLEQNKFPISDLKIKDFIVIGKDTADALREYDLEPALISEIETSEGLLEELTQKFDLKDKKILFPRSSLPNPYLKDELTKMGSQIDELPVYQNVRPAKKDLPTEAIDQILFTSPSTVRNFLHDYGAIPNHWKIWSKGPLTSKQLQELGYKSEVFLHE